MSDVAIRAENLGKRYRIGEREPYRALRDTLTNALYAPFRGAKSLFARDRRVTPQHRSREDGSFWALKDVSFEIRRGEVVGLIGRNGAGKSTLLKILSRVTEPTTGFAEINGRVGSLLEVGTGFHPELTGRENIFLNGAILGMKQREIRSRFDEIVAFAEVEKFLETPVKRYSSGMYTRLAFAVAAHLEPEILIVDEVLAVGDAAYQQKCMAKMEDVVHDGRTILLVSHNLSMVERLAQRSILLVSGQVEASGPTKDVMNRYLRSQTPQGGRFVRNRGPSDQSAARIVDFSISAPDDAGQTAFRMRSDIQFEIDCEFFVKTRYPYFSIEIHTASGNSIHELANPDDELQFDQVVGRVVARCCLRDVRLFPGQYFVRLSLRDRSHRILDLIDPAATFEIVPAAQAAKVVRPIHPRSASVDATTEWSLHQRSAVAKAA